jgi:hypothetical protein
MYTQPSRTLNRDLLTFLRLKNTPCTFFYNPEKIDDIIRTLTGAASEDELLVQFDNAIDKTSARMHSVWTEGLTECPVQENEDEHAWYTKEGQRIKYSSFTGRRLIYGSQEVFFPELC